MKSKAIYPLYPLLRFDSDIYVKNFERFIHFYSSPREAFVRGNAADSGKTLIVAVKRFTKAYEKHLNFKGGWKNLWMLEFSGSFRFPGPKKFNVTDHTGKVIPTPLHELKTYWASFLPDELDLTTQTYLLALTLAFPGTIRPTDNIWWVGGKKHKHSRFFKSIIHDGLEFIYKEGFKPGRELNPNQVIDWVFKSNGIFDGYSDTPASRSLNFLTRLFVKDYRTDELSDLVWAVAGIEALLVEGGRSSLGQLREKLAAVFHDRVDPSWIHKWVGNLYNYRSRMIHGDRQIRSTFREEEEVDSRFYEEYHSAIFAIGILAELLREVIARDVSKIQFVTAIKNA